MEGDTAADLDRWEGKDFNPLPPHGGRLHHFESERRRFDISIHSLRMEGDGGLGMKHTAATYISIHSLRMEGDCVFVVIYKLMLYFNPLPPHGGRQSVVSDRSTAPRHFNPLPPHGGRLFPAGCTKSELYFNPLPPHGGRPINFVRRLLITDFNPLPPHGGRLPINIKWYRCFPFQSTPSAWRETTLIIMFSGSIMDFNPLPPHGGRQTASMNAFCHSIISIHSLRMEGDFTDGFLTC